MPFWSTNFGEDKTLNDPKRKFRFIVSFNGIQAAQGGALLWYAKTAAKPSFKVETTEHTYLNHKFHYPGSISWEEISITLVDPVDPGQQQQQRACCLLLHLRLPLHVCDQTIPNPADT